MWGSYGEVLELFEFFDFSSSKDVFLSVFILKLGVEEAAGYRVLEVRPVLPVLCMSGLDNLGFLK